jgi:hypothetical protein
MCPNNPKQGLRMVCETDDSGKTDLIERIAKMSQQLENLTHVQSQIVKKNYACFYCGINEHIKKDCRKVARDKRNNCVKNNAIQNTAQSNQFYPSHRFHTPYVSLALDCLTSFGQQ